MSIPEKDRWYVWMIVKSLDEPRFKVIPLLQGLGITIYDRYGDEYIRRSDFKNLLYSVSG